MNNASKRKIEYNAAYNAKNYKQLKINVKQADYAIIDNYCKTSNISKAKFIVKCCKHCIDHDIKFDD